MPVLKLEKYEGLGNDFLIAIDTENDFIISSELAIDLCDRHYGIGADGLIALHEQDGTLVMKLRNADGSSAETSGNGLRCAALAAIDAGIATGKSFPIQTMAGVSIVEMLDSKERMLRVDMGEVSITEQLQSPLDDWRAWRVDVGNPHLVLMGGRVDEVDLSSFGRELDEETPGGLNVEVIELIGNDMLNLVVWERGVGLTLSCGTGSVAAGVAAHVGGFVSNAVEVVNPGGSCLVDLSEVDDRRIRAHLSGPARHVAHVEVDRQELNAEARVIP